LLLLLPFAFIAGAGTALSPCVLPVLPVVLSAGASGGRRRPAGVAAGIAVSFTFATVALVYVIDALGLPDDIARTLAVVVLVGFGIALLVPSLAARIEAWATRLVPAPRDRSGEGFGSGFLLGMGLGLVYAPCAGPILAGVITVSAAQDFTVGRLAVALAYGLGSAAALYALMLGGRRLTRPLSLRSVRFQQGVGAVMLVTAAVMVADVDMRFQTAIADDLPAWLVNPTAGIEESHAVESRLDEVRRRRASDLPTLGSAPELDQAGGRWFNTDPLTLEQLRGRVVLIDFWTYTCINCIRTLPYVKEWDRKYRDDGLTVIGVHTPEFPFERDPGNVEDAIEQSNIRYPVKQDNDYGTWDAFGNEYWPAKYLIDATGHVRYAHFGEGEYEDTERNIRSLLREAGRRTDGRGGPKHVERPSAGLATPETYLGYQRAQGFVNGPLAPGAQRFVGDPDNLPLNGFLYRGRWRVGPESATAGAGAELSLRFRARRVFLVMGSEGRARSVGVTLDGRSLPEVRVRRHRLYRLVDLDAAGEHLLTLDFERGLEGYAFTFG
jgi:cytochrome c biogenesis protein CcdA/thiol-disulfide isomerase/thioredoxin